MLTQEELKKEIKYTPETGLFEWLKPARIKRHGKSAGSNNRYININLNNKRYPAHRVAFLYMTGHFPKNNEIVDHIDRDNKNNKWENLRISDKSRNAINTKLYSNNSSGYRGVHWHNKHQRWVAKIAVKGKRLFLGEHRSKHDAATAYNEAAVKHFGDVAILNKIAE